MPFMVANSYFGLAVEGTYGVAASVSTYMPINSPKITPNYKWLDDSAFRGSPVMHYDQVPGVYHGDFNGKVYMYTDVFPNLIRAALGSTDTTASVGPSLYTHTFHVLNSPSTGSQPPSYTIWNNSVDFQYQIPGSRLADLSISFNADAAAEATFNFIGQAVASVAAPGSQTYSTQHIIPAWNCAASIAGTPILVVEQCTLNVKRNTAPIFTLGSQTPYSAFAGPIEADFSFVFVVEAGNPYFFDALTRDEQSFTLNFIDPVTNYAVEFFMTDMQLEDPVIDQSKTYLTFQSKGVAVANTTDAATGFAPIRAVVTNGISTPY